MTLAAAMAWAAAMALGAAMAWDAVMTSRAAMALGAAMAWAAAIPLDAAMTWAAAMAWGAAMATRVFHYSSFSTAPGACIIRAFSAVSLFLLPLHALDYARFPEILISHDAQFIHYHTPLFNQPVQAACCICRTGARQFDGWHSGLFFGVFMIQFI